MEQILQSPSRYMQGPGLLDRLPDIYKGFGRGGAFALVDAFIWERQGQRLKEKFREAGLPLQAEPFSGECTEAKARGIAERLSGLGSSAVIGIGGGKALDIAKAAAHFARLPLIVVPTVASTDAPCSAISVLYRENGKLDRYLYLDRNPDVVVVDSELVVQAPVRMLVAGMGDALSTYYEARACRRKADRSGGGGSPAEGDLEAGAPPPGAGADTPSRLAPLSAYLLADGCRRTLLEYGEQALQDARAGRLTPAVEHIIEANIYMSGIGFESGGLAAAHAIHNGLTLLEETGGVMHGEKVAFATAVQLVLENAPEAEIRELQNFCRRVGLPLTLRELHLDPERTDRLAIAAKASCSPESPMGGMPFAVTPDSVLDAMLEADRLGELVKRS